MLAFLLYWTYLDGHKLLKLSFSFLCSIYFGFRFNFLTNNLKKCPECYGDDLCEVFRNAQIELTWWSSFLWIVNPSLTKSVFYGEFKGKGVVVKRKAARRTGGSGFWKGWLSRDRVENVVLCPSVTDAEFLFDKVEGIERKTLWLDVNASIEPLLLVYFRDEGKWPVSEYEGACGDVIVEEHKGEPLFLFQDSPLGKRISLAIELLKLATLFTFAHPNFAFYFTDFSLDNLVVGSGGDVFLVDLDNVIISNKSHFGGNGSSKKTTHRSEVLDEYEYAFSPSDICGHYLSDHNFFSVCKYLLSHPKDGLLKDISKESSNAEILELLNECSEPVQMEDRFSAGQRLQSALQQVVDDNSIRLV